MRIYAKNFTNPANLSSEHIYTPIGIGDTNSDDLADLTNKGVNII